MSQERGDRADYSVNWRIESFDIAVDDVFCRFYENIIDDIFASHDAPRKRWKSQSEAVFAGILDKFETIQRDQSGVIMDGAADRARVEISDAALRAAEFARKVGCA